MANPPGPDEESALRDDDDGAATELIASASRTTDGDPPPPTPERRFTAPSAFDAGKTQVMNTAPEPETEVFAPLGGGAGAAAPTDRFAAPGTVAPQHIPGSGGGRQLAARRRSWGWVVAVILVILAIVAVAVFGTVLLTRSATSPAQSQRHQHVAALTMA